MVHRNGRRLLAGRGFCGPTSRKLILRFISNNEASRTSAVFYTPDRENGSKFTEFENLLHRPGQCRGSVGIRAKRASQRAHEKEAAGHCGHPGTGNPWRGAILQRDTQAHALPHCPAIRVGAIGTADTPVALQKQPRPDGIGETGDQRKPTVEAMQ